MKKILLLGVISALSFCLFAQNSTMFILIDITSDDGYEYQKYFYNSDNLLNEKLILYSDGMEARENYYYNQSNKVEKIDGFQLIDNTWRHTYYIDYTYDVNGNRISRANYNSFGTPDFSLGGIYNYQYVNNILVGWELTMMGDIVEQGTSTYNEQGKIIEELGQENWSGTGMQNSWRVVYVYNANGSLQKTSQYFWDMGYWELSSSDVFSYDDNGNCIKWEHFNDGVVTNKYEYEYDLEVSKNQIILPYSPEDDADPLRWVEKNNKMVLSHWYTQNDANQLIYICDYFYHYTTISGIIDNKNVERIDVMIFPNPATEQITIYNENNLIKNLNIIDASGKIVFNNYYLNDNIIQIDVSQFAAGVYVLKAMTSKGSVSRRIVIK